MNLEKLNAELMTCRKCPRLVEWREKVAREKRRAYIDSDYWGKPVPGFGDPHASVFVVGLAPGAHGSNRTGRQFTGDASGDFFYPALFRAGFANQPESDHRGDGLALTDLYTAPVCRCAPPQNKPLPDEMKNCEQYLRTELAFIKPKVIVVLGRIAFERVLTIYSARKLGFVFGHAAQYKLLSGEWLLCSYHPSQQNTLTGRLTVPMFDHIWQTARLLSTNS